MILAIASFANTVLWVYIVLLLVGGAFGYFKAKSKPSLIASASFAVLLSLCALRIVFYDYVADFLLVALLGIFCARLIKTKKFMPAGLMLVLTVLTLGLRRLGG